MDSCILNRFIEKILLLLKLTHMQGTYIKMYESTPDVCHSNMLSKRVEISCKKLTMLQIRVYVCGIYHTQYTLHQAFCMYILIVIAHDILVGRKH